MANAPAVRTTTPTSMSSRYAKWAERSIEPFDLVLASGGEHAVAVKHPRSDGDSRYLISTS